MLGTQRVKALSHVSLSLAEGAFVCLSGPSGSGKTTLLNVLGMIEPVQEGELRMQGKSIGGFRKKKRITSADFRSVSFFRHFIFSRCSRRPRTSSFFSRARVSPVPSGKEGQRGSQCGRPLGP